MTHIPANTRMPAVTMTIRFTMEHFAAEGLGRVLYGIRPFSVK